ncbi:MAG: hypothetical protein B6D57_03515 [Candidatus Coatesbacteria bacterium 4484_99]|uniref:DUF4159 domain-containing protein n=1 Tax=Candidatus Coatesbacteria bacterium 4484_99 TaxID=1970774 RepID=A0A1W9S157_9BACT|nr:MAG: hypothetical protein B6D57_03515 [Candidatus Coatesbacteria bacterium 4484_99]
MSCNAFRAAKSTSYRTLIMLTLLICFGSAFSTDFLIWDNDTGGTFTDPEDTDNTIGSEYWIENTLTALGYTVDTTTSLPDDLSQYMAIFALFGFYPYNGTLDAGDEEALITYLQNGGALYIEGCDFAFAYGSTELFSYTGAKFENDGRYYTEGNVNFANGVNGTMLEGISMQYYAYQTELPDNYVDEISAETGTLAMVSLRAGIQSNGRVILNRIPYRIIYSSFIFSTLKDGEGGNTKENLMNKYLTYLTQSGEYIENSSIGVIRSLFR